MNIRILLSLLVKRDSISSESVTYNGQINNFPRAQPQLTEPKL